MTVEEKQKILEAVEIIQKECSRNENCYTCAFHDGSFWCLFGGNNYVASIDIEAIKKNLEHINENN